MWLYIKVTIEKVNSVSTKKLNTPMAELNKLWAQISIVDLNAPLKNQIDQL